MLGYVRAALPANDPDRSFLLVLGPDPMGSCPTYLTESVVMETEDSRGRSFVHN